MLLQVLLTLAGLVVGIAILGYHPVPEEIEDPIATQLVFIPFKLVQVVHSVREFFGYRSIYRSMDLIFPNLRQEGAPKSAFYGGLQVTRSKVAGVPVIIYQQKDSSRKYPGIIYFHGGGWIFGNTDTYDPLTYEYSLQTGTNVISVDYRLAPEYPFPIPVQDCLDVTRHVLRHGEEFNIDVNKVGVAGDSAGGNLASAVALKLSREKSDLPALVFQILHYPAMQAFDLRLPSCIDNNNTTPILSQDRMAEYYAAYMGIENKNMDYYASVIRENRHIPVQVRQSKYAQFVDVKLLPAEFQSPKKPIPAPAPGHDANVYAKIKDIVTNPLFSPLMAPDLTGLPPAFIHVCKSDVLRDDGLLYARRLQDAGVHVQLYVSKGGYHGDVTISTIFSSVSGRAAVANVISFIKDILK